MMPVRLSLTLLACASALALSACKDDRPPTPVAYDFASAPPAAVEVNAPAEYGGYALAERAHAFDRATYRSAPSYGFRYGDEEPWAWRTADDYSMYAEPYDDGYRSYYYEPGADYPYFVRDDDYGYGYGRDGRLIAVYDASGALLPQDRLHALARLAGIYLVRASAVRRYGLDDRYRVSVSDAYWADNAPRYQRTREVWYAAPERQPQWRQWRTSHEREAASFVPRGEVRRWNKADDRAWKAYEQADRKAWQAEDKAWRKPERQPDRRVALAPPTPVARAIQEDGRDRGQDRRIQRRDEGPVQQRAAADAPRDPERHDKAAGKPDRRVALAPPTPVARAIQGDGRDRGQDRRIERRDETPVQQRAAADEPRGPERHDKAAGKPDRAQLAAAAEARRGADASARRPQAQPVPAPRDHGAGGQDHPRPQQVAKAEPPAVQAAPPREHGEGRRAEGHPQAAAPGPRPERRADGGGKPPAAATPVPRPRGKGGGKPERGDKADKGRESRE